MFIFSIGGTTYGMCEETVPFYLLLAATMVAAGFDSLTGAAVVLLGAGVGVMGSTVNPFAVGVAVVALNGIGVSVNQGIIIALGVIIWLVSLAIAIVFVMRYAKKVKADKGSTFLSLQEQQDMMNEWGMKESETEAADDDAAATPKMSGRQKWSLIVFALHVVPAHGAHHRRHRRRVREPLREGVHQRRRRHDVGRAHHRARPLHHRAHGQDGP